MKKILSLLVCAVMVLILVPILPQSAAAASISNFNIRLNEPIASYSPDFSPEFNTDVQLYHSVTWQENSPGFSAKLNSSDEFKAGLAYKVDIWVKFGDGNYLATDIYGDLAAALTVNGKAISSLKINGRNAQGQINDVTITCEYGPLSGREISSAMVTGIPTPVAGNMPIYSFTIGNNTAYSFYHTQPIVWWDMTTGDEMDSGDTFIAGHKYQINIYLQANRENGFTFKLNSSGDPAVSVTLNSWAADAVYTAYEQDPREVIDIRYTFPACQAAHTCAPKLVPQQDPTCLLSGFRAYYECSCGKCYEDAAATKEITDMDGYGILAAHGHIEAGWSYNGTHHYKKCTVCKEVIPGTNAAHSGGKATCVEKGKCTTCGYAYQPENENHTPDTKWTACAGLYHAKLCKLCGAHCTPQDHKPGAAATEEKPQTCTICGYILEPAKNHTHKMTHVEANEPTCTHPGNKEYYLCNGCDGIFADEKGKTKITDSVLLEPLGHKIDDQWSMDETYHWHVCTVCELVLEETKMEHGDEKGKCATCGYEIGAQVTTPETTEQTKPTKQTEPETTAPTTEQPAPQEENGGANWLVIVLVFLVCFAAAATVTVILLKMKKKGDAK